MQTHIKQQLKAAVVGLAVAVGVSYAFAWTGPTTTPPGNNVSAPINVGYNSQSKSGQLILNAATSSPYATGLLAFGESVFDSNGSGQPAIQINDGTAQPGYVLTSTDTNGTAEWAAASSTGGSSGTIVYTTPTALVSSLSGSAVPWTTISLSQYGVPSNASAVILGSFVTGGQDSNNAIYVRPNSAGPTYGLSHSQSNGSGGPVGGGFNEGIYPISASGDSIDYETDGNLYTDTEGPPIALYGYIIGGGYNVAYPTSGVSQITAGSNITVSPSGGTGNVTISASSTIVSSGSVGGGCYGSSVTSSGNTFAYTAWGNASISGSGPGSCTCPSNYTAYITAENPLTVKTPDGYMCVHN